MPLRVHRSSRRALHIGRLCPVSCFSQCTGLLQPINWICRAGSEEICTTGLDFTVITADGHKTPQHFEPAKNPPIDCFYVYPTISREPTPFADMTDSSEIQQVVKAQAGRLSSRCRVFAPIYRQTTLYQLRQSFAGTGQMDFDQPLLDVQAAWAYYLQHDNQGRGVVFVGHSQGSILLQALMMKSIDGTPSQALLVSAFLAGDPSLGVPAGKSVGGTFTHIPVCSAIAQTGCVYPWGTYLDDDASPSQIFGRARTDGLVSACVNPAAPSGGSGQLKSYYENQPGSSATDTPWVESIGQLSGSCKTDARGNAFRATVDPGPWATDTRALLKKSEIRTGWGLHLRDIALVQGNMLDVLDAEIAIWKKSH